MKIQLQQLAERVGATLRGAGNVTIAGVASVNSAGADDLVFAQDEQRLREALASRAGAVLTGEFAAQVVPGKPLLIAGNPRLAFARAAQELAGGAGAATGVHPSAVVDSSARLGADVSIGAYAVIGARAVVGERSRIGAGSHIAANAVVGADCEIGSNVSIHSSVRTGDRVVVQSGSVLGSDGFGYVRDEQTGRHIKFPQIGSLEIQDDVEIGAGCTLDRGALDATVIGRGAKLDNLVHIGHNARIGANVVIAAQAGISGSVTIEDDVTLAGQVGIADHAVIKRGAVLGGQAGVPSKKVVRAAGEPLWGTPARPIGQYLRELATLARLARRGGAKQ